MIDILKIATVVVLMCGSFAFGVAVSHERNGDMNSDGELTIVDLSILAEVIRNENN